MRHTDGYRKKFTLIEMLVVIAIISILASMLAPGLQKALDNARSLACVNNLKQTGMTFAQYMDDYNGYFPGYGEYDAADLPVGKKCNLNQWRFKELMQAYQIGLKEAKKQALWFCPACTEAGHRTDGDPNPNWVCYAPRQGFYGMNWVGPNSWSIKYVATPPAHNDNNPDRVSAFKVNQWTVIHIGGRVERSPSKFLLLGEIKYGRWFPRTFQVDYYQWESLDYFMSVSRDTLTYSDHNGKRGQNLLFLDGRAKAFPDIFSDEHPER